MTRTKKSNSSITISRDLYMATIMLTTDHLPTKIDTVFLYSRSFGDDAGLFELTSNLYKNNVVKSILITDSDGRRDGGIVPAEAWPGKDSWIQKLTNFGVDRIILTSEAYNTKSESYSFLYKAKELDFKSAVVIAQPHQIVRVMLTLVKVMAKTHFYIRIYCLCPHSTSWSKEVYGSQGNKSMPRKLHIQEEFKRIVKYQKTDDLVNFPELFTYLAKREKMV